MAKTRFPNTPRHLPYRPKNPFATKKFPLWGLHWAKTHLERLVTRKGHKMKFIWELDEFEHKGMTLFAVLEIEAEYVASHGYWNAEFTCIKQPDGTMLRIDDDKDWQWMMPLVNDWLNDPKNRQTWDAGAFQAA